ncbi:uncharacterized protein LOC122231494 [Panthera tigris]|uniref:uncharacterized protein LOC122231494 n=1 Tax=Panthera tigris TaxID=9694 RepID=UPI001C6F72BD|nr:uncharacterized protein LOC122231494 [Panthera tigris]
MREHKEKKAQPTVITNHRSKATTLDHPSTVQMTTVTIMTEGSRILAPATPIAPHLTLPEPLPPPQPEPPEQPRCEPFPSQPPPRDSADSTASQAQHVTSDQRSTAFRAQASGGLAGADGLPEVVGGAWARPARLELRVWGPGSPGKCRAGSGYLSSQHQARDRDASWNPSRPPLRPGVRQSPKYSIVPLPSPGIQQSPPTRLWLPDSWFWPQAAAILVCDWKTERSRMDVKWMKPSNHCNKPAYTSQEMRRLDRVAMLWRSLETTVFFVAMATNSYS